MFKLIYSLAALGLLTGCGFKPIYGTAGPANIIAQLSTVQVVPIKDRIGQQLRNLLLDRINPRARPANLSYKLSVQLRVETRVSHQKIGGFNSGQFEIHGQVSTSRAQGIRGTLARR